jgi:hypothetical protein
MPFRDKTNSEIGESQFGNTDEIARLRRRYSSSLKLRRNQLWRTGKPGNDSIRRLESIYQIFEVTPLDS